MEITLKELWDIYTELSILEAKLKALQAKAHDQPRVMKEMISNSASLLMSSKDRIYDVIQYWGNRNEDE